MIQIEHNLTDMEFLNVLEKAIGAVRKKVFAPKSLEDPFTNSLAEIWVGVFQDHTNRMLQEIEKVLAE